MKNNRITQVDIIEIKYSDLPGGLTSWQDSKLYRPFNYDLVDLKLSNKTITGWWTGNGWMGLRLRKGDKVISWKKSKEIDFI